MSDEKSELKKIFERIKEDAIAEIWLDENGDVYWLDEILLDYALGKLEDGVEVSVNYDPSDELIFIDYWSGKRDEDEDDEGNWEYYFLEEKTFVGAVECTICEGIITLHDNFDIAFEGTPFVCRDCRDNWLEITVESFL